MGGGMSDRVGCLSHEELAAFADGTLTPNECRIATEHIAGCSRCVALVSAAMRFNQAEDEHVARRRSRVRTRTMAVAAVVAGLVTAPALWITIRSPLAPLRSAAADAKSRVVEARLDGLPWKPYSPPRAAPDGSLLAVRATAEKIVKDSGRADRLRERYAAAVALVVQGDNRSAIGRLTELARQHPNEGQFWSDLAAAYIDSANRNDSPADLRDALAAGTQALRIDPHDQAAQFNVALALERLGLREAAIDAWTRYIQADPTSPWASEARTRIARLRNRTSTDLWQGVNGELKAAAAAGNAVFVRATVSRFPQEARTWGEWQYLEDWARALLRGDRAAAVSNLGSARTIAAALRDHSGESLLADAVSAVDASAGSPEIERAIATAQDNYYNARISYSTRRNAEALPQFLAAVTGFQRGGSPMALVAEYYTASAMHDLGRSMEALPVLLRIAHEAKPSYRALHAQIAWERGTIEGTLGRYNDALASYLAAQDSFHRLGERNNEASTRSLCGWMYNQLGRPADAWRAFIGAFDALSVSGDRERLQLSIDHAARSECIRNRWMAGAALLEVLSSSGAITNVRVRADAFIWRSVALHHIHRDDEALAVIRSAASAALAIPDRDLRESAMNDVRFVEAIVRRESNPAESVRLMSGVIDFATAHQLLFLLPEALLERARGWRLTKDHERARADLERSLDLIETRRRSIASDDLRDAYFSTSEAASRELIEILDRRTDIGRLFAATESARGRAILDRLPGQAAGFGEPLAADAIRESLATGTVLLHYTALSDRLLIFAIDRTGMTLHRVLVRADVIRAAADRLIAAIQDGDDDGSRTEEARLSEILLAPAASRVRTARLLVIVGDQTTSAIPFAVLRSPTTGQSLIEQVALAYAPSASAFVRNTRERTTGSVIVVGNPAFDAGRFPNFEHLPGASDEAADVAKLYPDSTLLLRDAATHDRLIEELPSAAVVHISAHGVTNSGDDPWQSFLLLAPSPNSSGALYLDEISRIPLRAPVVFLSACGTASGPKSAVDLRTITMAFLAAGASSSIGSLWDVNDSVASEVSIDFHRNLRHGLSPAAALQAAQIHAIHSDDPALRAQKTWGGFELFGRGD